MGAGTTFILRLLNGDQFSVQFVATTSPSRLEFLLDLDADAEVDQPCQDTVSGRMRRIAAHLHLSEGRLRIAGADYKSLRDIPGVDRYSGSLAAHVLRRHQEYLLSGRPLPSIRHLLDRYPCN